MRKVLPSQRARLISRQRSDVGSFINAPDAGGWYSGWLWTASTNDKDVARSATGAINKECVSTASLVFTVSWRGSCERRARDAAAALPSPIPASCESLRQRHRRSHEDTSVPWMCDLHGYRDGSHTIKLLHERPRARYRSTLRRYVRAAAQGYVRVRNCKVPVA
jgi:hypothetical protein